MQNSHKLFAGVLGAILVSGITVSSAFAQTAVSPKVIGVIDRDKVVTAYSKAQTAADELKRSEEKVQKLVEDANKQYEEAKKANKPPAELEGLQKRLQTQIDDEVKRLQSRVQTLESQLEGEIDSAIKAEAAQHRVDVVIMKQAVLLGGVDLTDGVVKRLSMATAAGATKSGGATK